MTFTSDSLLAERYQLQQRLGNTAIGRQTWLAIDVLSQESVIIKLLAFSPQMEWEELKLFEREAAVLASLHHPRIPRYRDYFSLDKNQGDGIPWFVLVQDYIPGESLSDRLERGQRFTATVIRTIAQEVLEILIYLHELSPPVLHRDIKPSNLIINSENNVYLVDFGAVQSRGAVTGVTFTVVGTSGYAPLEQFWGRAVPSSDLYALGMTLIHLLTGIVPIELPHRNSKIQFRQLVTIDDDLIDWLETMTDMAVEKRFKSARESLKFLQHPYYRQASSLIDPKKLPKPPHSSIRIAKHRDNLEINLPPKIKLLSDAATLWSLAIVLTVSIFISPILTFIIALIGFICLREMQLILTPQEVLIKYKFLNFIYKKFAFKTQDLWGIFLHSNGTEGNYQIRLRTAKNYYLIGQNLREDECLWLGQEIQDWLNFIKYSVSPQDEV
ncbi:MAG: serine/threonine protein kinase [Microcystis sp.]